MSIRHEIRDRVSERRLIELSPALTSSPFVRTMLISPAISDLVFGPWENPEHEYRCGRLRADLDMFIDGSVISVAQRPYKKPRRTYMSRLDKPHDEVWEIRSRDPKPGLRVFGRFAEKDVFIALTWAPRDWLGPPWSNEWESTKRHCAAEWRQLFPTYNPLAGGSFHDYVSNIILV